MTKLPRLKAVQIIKVLEKRGFKLSRQSGGHKIYKDNRGKRVLGLNFEEQRSAFHWANKPNKPNKLNKLNKLK
jgi:hypothetical protein